MLIAGKYLHVIRGIDSEADIHSIILNDAPDGQGDYGRILGVSSPDYYPDDDPALTSHSNYIHDNKNGDERNDGNSNNVKLVQLGPFLGSSRSMLKYDLGQPGDLDDCIRHSYRYSSRALLKLLGMYTFILLHSNSL